MCQMFYYSHYFFNPMKINVNSIIYIGLQENAISICVTLDVGEYDANGEL